MIETTATHPFYIAGRGWTEARYLEVGNRSVTKDNSAIAIKEIVIENKTVTVYNFTVEEDHNYFVGQDGVLVHNVDYGDVSTVVHAALDIAGMAPAAGIVPDAVNALYHAGEAYLGVGIGTYTDAGFSAAAALPLIGDAAMAAKIGTRYGEKILKYGDKAVDVVKSGTDAAETLAKNKQAGKLFEEEAAASYKSKYGNVQEQVTIKSNTSGTKTKVDIVSKEKGEFKLGEAKSSKTAPLTKNQKIAFPEIEKCGGVVCGKGKPGIEGGTKIPPTKVEIIRGK